MGIRYNITKCHTEREGVWNHQKLLHIVWMAFNILQLLVSTHKSATWRRLRSAVDVVLHDGWSHRRSSTSECRPCAERRRRRRRRATPTRRSHRSPRLRSFNVRWSSSKMTMMKSCRALKTTTPEEKSFGTTKLPPKRGTVHWGLGIQTSSDKIYKQWITKGGLRLGFWIRIRAIEIRGEGLGIWAISDSESLSIYQRALVIGSHSYCKSSQ